jgi:hypothetical protein
MDPSPSSLDRRGFLRTTAGGAAAVAVASVLPAGCARDYPQADSLTLASLSPKEFAVARAAAEALLPGVPVDPTSVATRIDHELAAVGDPIRADMRSVLRLMEHLTLLGGHVTRFTALEPEDRLSYLRGWSTSRFELRRAAFQALRGFVSYFAYIQDETRPLTGFPGPWPERFELALPPVDYGEIA